MRNRTNNRSSGNKLRQHRYALNSALRSIGFYRWAVITNTLILGLLLAFPIGLFCGLKYLDSADLASMPARIAQINFTVDTDDLAKDNLRSRILSNPLFSQASFVSGEEVMQQLLNELGIAESSLLLELNPFTDRVTTKLSSKASDQRAIESLLDELRQEQAIASIEIIETADDRTLGLEPTLYLRVASLVGGTILFSVILLCGNMVRSQLTRQQLEIEVTRYCGAEPAFIRRPFLYWGTIQTLLGTFLGIVIVFICWGFLRAPTGELLGDRATLPVSPISIPETTIALLFGGLLGWIAAWFATKIHLSADIDA